ncbi:hypothetical protein [Teredinibacter purpureus]|uniref:hypothetical protein n=1 Tax=Teredinibacter purpureus TaxID=2731756 RepID=UPI0005F7FAE5|nr:hypothetical protein [Teredinibacter purpureus]
MKMKSLVGLIAVSASLVACGGGDIVIEAQNNSVVNDNSIANSNNTTTPVNSGPDFSCAFYNDENGVRQEGQVDGVNCIYSESFVDFDNPILTSITLANIGEGAHIFAGSVFVGQNYDTIADATAAGIEKGGDGPTLNVRAGVTVALQNSEDFIAISRGSRIEAVGTADMPVTFTSEVDVNGSVGAEDVQTWGGMIINGFGFTNSCQYEAGWDYSDTGLALVTGEDCSKLVEGTEGSRSQHFGGTVPSDNSGTLRYVVVKHAGFEITAGNELNGITFGAVGSGTTLSNLEIYANKDDGVEFFGGGANLTNYVAMYVQDDSIDLDHGYYGTIQNALIIQGGAVGEMTKTGAHCVESDGSASSLKGTNITNGYVGKAVINNLTCISSAKGPSVAGNSDPGAGINAEEAHHLTLNRSIVTTAYSVDATTDGAGDAIDAGNLDFTNYCFQLEDSEDLSNAGNGLVNINTTIFACADIAAQKSRSGDFVLTAGTEYGAITGQAFLEAQDNVVALNVADDGTTPPNAGNLNILNGFYSLPLAEMVVDGNVVAFDTAVTHVGAVVASDDWTAGWTYGLHDGNRGQALWFE